MEYFKAHPTVEPAPLGRAVVAGTGWAKVVLENNTVKQGETLKADVSGLDEGTQITAVLHSDPLEALDIPAANAEGETSFEIEVPADFTTGDHTLLVSTEGKEDIALDVEVAAVSAPIQTPTPSESPAPSEAPELGGEEQVSSQSPAPVAPQANDGGNTPEAAPQPNGDLASTGATVGTIAGAGILLMAVGGFLLWRRHRASVSDTK